MLWFIRIKFEILGFGLVKNFILWNKTYEVGFQDYEDISMSVVIAKITSDTQIVYYLHIEIYFTEIKDQSCTLNINNMFSNWICGNSLQQIFYKHEYFWWDSIKISTG